MARTPWNLQSKRFLVVLFVCAIYTATLCICWKLFEFMTPYTMGFLAAYIGVESWRPAGVTQPTPPPDVEVTR